jgi:hypothetical protein
MGAAAGHIPAVGPYGIVIALMLPVIAVTGTIAILLLVRKIPETEIEITIRMLGIRVRRGHPREGKNEPDDSSVPSLDEKGNAGISTLDDDPDE